MNRGILYTGVYITSSAEVCGKGGRRGGGGVGGGAVMSG